MITEETNPEELETTPTIPEETPAEATVSEATPVEETVVEETLVEETVVEETLVEETVVEETVVEETVVEETVVEETAVVETAVEAAAPAEVVFPVVEEKAVEFPSLDLSKATKESILAFYEQLKAILQASASSANFKKVDELTKEVRTAWEAMKQGERAEAIAAFKAGNEDSEEGFSFKGDEISQKIDAISAFIRTERSAFFSNLEKLREKALEGKTRLINDLRTLVDSDDNSDPAHVNASFKAFKKIQEEWKGLGSVQGPMNQTLWQSYHALVDRFYSNRSIFFELLELDRKKNLQAKEVIAAKLEVMAAAISEGGNVQKLLKEAEELFEEYKHIGPANRDDNEALWTRVKKSLDILFEQKRALNDAQKQVFTENLKVKREIADLMKHYASFTAANISEWNQASKAVLALQEQWNNLKGGLPRDGGKEVSQNFWSDLKTFFKHKSEFFSKIDAERKANLAAKQALIDQVNGIVETGTITPEVTQMVIETQKKWKEIGHVPEKQKDSIYAKFKAACDDYFNLTREKGKNAKDVEFEANLEAKQAILTEMGAMLQDPSLLASLGQKKAAWDAIGFVPRRDVKVIQESFRNTWNALIDLARTQPKEQLAAWGFELKSLASEANTGGEEKKSASPDARKKIQTLENDIAVLTNNLEFFAKSKNSDKLREEVEKKIAQAEKELAQLKKD
ncbi:DUF349 domain-containing protein [Aquirufa sp. A-Brett2-15D]